ncbi:hypothetical protein RQP46_007406 [Phenoliferia psychrophenolica]
MIPATRRTLSCALLDSRPLLSSFTIGSSKDLEPSHRLLSTSPVASNNPRTRPSKAKSEELAQKVERKRTVRVAKAIKQDAKNEQARIGRIQKELELQHKRQEGQALAEDLPPMSDAELEGIYRGLLEAKPEELAVPALVAPASPLLLVASTSDSESRRGRLANLTERLDSIEKLTLEGVVEDGEASAREDDEPLAFSSPLAEMLKARRMGSVVEDDANSGADASSTEFDAASSLGRQLLDRVESVLPRRAVAASEGLVVPMGLVVPSEWRDLVLLCAEEGDGTGVEKALGLMQRTSPVEDAGLLTDVMAAYASAGRSREALSLASYARSHSLPLSVSTHHHLLSSLLPAHPELAIQHLHSLEAAGYTPLLDTYTLLIAALLSPSTPAHLTSRGWDLYAHTRLVSHPTPSASLYATMIAACARGSHPSPERAIDLFTEMTSDNQLAPTAEVYNALIRACARRGTQDYYFEALRFMRQMLDDNVPPSRQTFHAVLEGARRHGDLPRARWMLVKMVGVGGDAAPDASSLGLVFQTYAAYKPPVAQAGTAKRAGKGARKVTVVSPEGFAAAATTTTSTARALDRPDPAEEPRSEAQGLVDLLGESSIFYPGPLPQTTDALLAEAANLMSQCVPSDLLGLSLSTPTSSTIFPSVLPNTFLLNSYLGLLAAHAPFDAMMAFWRTAYSTLDVERNRFSFETVMRRCETAKNRVVATESAREVFAEWKAWEGPKSAVVEVVEEAEDVESVAASAGASHKSGRNISLMWAHMIRILSRSYSDVEALALFQSFITQYPPHQLTTRAEYAREAARLLPTLPSPIRLSSALYPETSTSASAERPPYLLFEQVRLLHQRLAEVENERGVATVMGICKAYEWALKSAKEIEEGVVKMKANQKKKEGRKEEGESARA